MNLSSHSCIKFVRSSAQPENGFCLEVLKYLSSPFTALMASMTIAWSWGSVIKVPIASVLSISSSEEDLSFISSGTGGNGKSLCVTLVSKGESSGGLISSSDSLRGIRSL